MTLITVYALFSENLKNLLTYRDADEAFSAASLLIIVIFSFEFILSCYCLDEYCNGFYFYLDIISILSMLLDVEWISSIILGTSTSKSLNPKSLGALAKAGKAARVGSKAIRILRIIKIIRQIRIIKLYKKSEKAFTKFMDKKNSDEIPSESRVGKKLSELTSRRVVILVFVMILGIIFLDSTFYYEP